MGAIFMKFNFKDFFQSIIALIAFLFPPKVKPSPVITPNAPPGTPPIMKIQLADIIKSYNAAYKAMYPLIGGTVVNAEIHAIDDATRIKVANLIESEAKKVNDDNLDSTYLASCIMQESRFDPNCYNHNLGHDNPTPNFEHTDWGMCQMAGTYLPAKPGMPVKPKEETMVPTWKNTMATLACTPEWAVANMAKIMVGNLAAAKKHLQDDEKLRTNTRSLNNTSLTDAQFLATLYYNRGMADDEVKQVGGRYYVKHLVMDRIKHPFRVGNWYKTFSEILNGQPPSKAIASGYDECFADYDLHPGR